MQWYSGGPVFKRDVIQGRNGPEVDLYPTALKYKLRMNDGSVDNTESKVLIPSDIQSV